MAPDAPNGKHLAALSSPNMTMTLTVTFETSLPEVLCREYCQGLCVEGQNRRREPSGFHSNFQQCCLVTGGHLAPLLARERRRRKDNAPFLLPSKKTPGRLAAACQRGFLFSLNHEYMLLL